MRNRVTEYGQGTPSRKTQFWQNLAPKNAERSGASGSLENPPLRPGYYAAPDAISVADEDLAAWQEYCAERVKQPLAHVWLRVQASQEKLVLRPKQELLLKLLRDHGSISPAERWETLAISSQGAMVLRHLCWMPDWWRKSGEK
jgi:hypothetical protein